TTPQRRGDPKPPAGPERRRRSDPDDCPVGDHDDRRRDVLAPVPPPDPFFQPPLGRVDLLERQRRVGARLRLPQRLPIVASRPIAHAVPPSKRRASSVLMPRTFLATVRR